MANEAKFMSAMNKPTVDKQFEAMDEKNKGSIIKRAAERMDIFRAQYDELGDKADVVIKAKELLKKYGSSSNIPVEELDFNKSGFDDARLLAMAQIIEE